jgi:hypothetical protein
MARESQIITYPDDPTLKRETALHRLSTLAGNDESSKLIFSSTIPNCRIAL